MKMLQTRKLRFPREKTSLIELPICYKACGAIWMGMKTGHGEEERTRKKSDEREE
jgi:hypothetical protein